MMMMWTSIGLQKALQSIYKLRGSRENCIGCRIQVK